jgi:hypothetical protein
MFFTFFLNIITLFPISILNPTRGVCESHCGQVAIYIKKYLKAKEELWKLKYFTIAKI